jgi:hypothetical protein
MKAIPCTIKTATFFQRLEQTLGLDGRDDRGKKHSIGLIVKGFIKKLSL